MQKHIKKIGVPFLDDGATTPTTTPKYEKVHSVNAEKTPPACPRRKGLGTN
jgi:hypothetical protein